MKCLMSYSWPAGSAAELIHSLLQDASVSGGPRGARGRFSVNDRLESKKSTAATRQNKASPAPRFQGHGGSVVFDGSQR